MRDETEWFLFWGTTTVILLLIIIDGMTHVAADSRAQSMCVNRGYETFVTYSRIPMIGLSPHALVCGTMTQRMIYEGKIIGYNVNGNKSIIIGGSIKR